MQAAVCSSNVEIHENKLAIKQRYNNRTVLKGILSREKNVSPSYLEC